MQDAYVNEVQQKNEPSHHHKTFKTSGFGKIREILQNRLQKLNGQVEGGGDVALQVPLLSPTTRPKH